MFPTKQGHFPQKTPKDWRQWRSILRGENGSLGLTNAPLFRMNTCCPVTHSPDPATELSVLDRLCGHWGHGQGWTSTSMSVEGSSTLHSNRAEWSFLLTARGTGSSAEPPKRTCQPGYADHGAWPPKLLTSPSPQQCPCCFHNIADPSPLPLQITPPGQPTPDRVARSWGPRMASRAEVHVCSYAFLLFLFPFSSTCILFQMFPNTSCLVRYLRQTERCHWRRCFRAQFVHSFTAKLK